MSVKKDGNRLPTAPKASQVGGISKFEAITPTLFFQQELRSLLPKEYCHVFGDPFTVDSIENNNYSNHVARFCKQI